MQITDFIMPELLVLVPVLYIIGKAIKQSQFIADKFIPLVLGFVGVALSILWVCATIDIPNTQTVLLAVFTAFVQGVLCAGAAVYTNQLIKQGGKKNE